MVEREGWGEREGKRRTSSRYSIEINVEKKQKTKNKLMTNNEKSLSRKIKFLWSGI